MSLYTHLRAVWKKPKEGLGELYKEKLIQYRKEPVTVRIERPTRLDRARSLGYKAKQGVFVVRQRVIRGGHKREQVAGGRRPKASRQSMVGAKNYQRIAEERVAKKYLNCEVLNSYFLIKDGRYVWYEVIMVDKKNPSVLANKQLAQAVANNKKASRGLTSAGKKSRGLNNKGKGAEKARPGVRANKGRGK